jgi:hypothetical protein
VHPEAWLTVKTSPSMVSVPDRAGPSQAATLKPTVPDPAPVCPEVIEIQGALLCADHSHPAAVVTAIVPDPPLALTDWAVGAIDVVHPSP